MVIVTNPNALEVSESGLGIQKGGIEELDDDGKIKRTGNLWSATAHIITTVIGSGVLSLAWAVSQLGWLGGVATLLVFAGITLYTSGLLADCYRSPVTGNRNYTYMEVVRNNLGGKWYKACGIVQYSHLAGALVGYTITASISMVAIHKSHCFHHRGHEARCEASHIPYMIGLGILEIFLSQIPNFHKLSILSMVAAFMSIGYSAIGLGLGFSKIVTGDTKKTSLTGVSVGIGLSVAEKIWRMFKAFGNIAFAYTYSVVLVEIQDTLKASPPENKVMRKANLMAMSTTTIFYMMCGCFGYAAFGNNAPGNLLTGFGFYEPYWLVDMANIFIVVHLVGVYQVFTQPLFKVLETWASRKWPKSNFVTEEYPINIAIMKTTFNVNFLRLTWRTLFVITTTLIAMIIPFFNDVLAILGALGYWPLTVFFPIQMYIAQKQIGRWTCKWISLQLINLFCCLVAIAAAGGAIQGIGEAFAVYKPFHVND